jgi:hypothetical protein
MSVENLPTYDQLLVKLSQLAQERCEDLQGGAAPNFSASAARRGLVSRV